MKLTALLFAGLLALPLRAAETAGDRPNVLVILSDDQGYGDLGFQGCQDIPTPNLDRLAHDGVHCTSAYVSHPYCSPSRAGMLTGRYQARFGHEHNPVYNPNSHREGLPLTEKLLPQFLLPAGYATGWIGKWHLGAATEFRPENRGFQEAFGFLSGVHRYLGWTPSDKVENSLPIEENGTNVAVTEHLTLAFGHKAESFVRRHADQPWFLYLAFNAPHDPEEPTPERLARFQGIPDRQRRRYAAQVSLLDDAAGGVLTALRETGQERRTLVFFFSDNGAPFGNGNGGSGPNGGSNLPLRDGKHSVYEGGIHVPFVVSWPGHLPAGKVYDRPVSSLDVFATTLAAAHIPMPTDKPYDGVDLVPYLTGENSGTPHDELFWRDNERGQAAMREGEMKLVRDGAKPDQLFNLTTDIGESKDLAGHDAVTTGKMAEGLAGWMGQMSKKLAFQGQQGPERAWPVQRKAEPVDP